MTPSAQQLAARAFKAMHAAPTGFVMPNAWDAGSAILLAEAGFEAIATTSAGIAFSLGKPDYAVAGSGLGVTREEMLDRIRQLVAAVPIPVSGDLEAGYGDAPEAVAETIGLAIEAGLAGGNIEDRRPDAPGLYEEDLAVERIAAARAAIDARDNDFVLTARVDAFLAGDEDALATCIRRGNRYLEAGATCIFTPGAPDMTAVAILAREIAGPINIVMGLGSAPRDARAILAAGVQRISLGGSFARAALGLIRQGAGELRTQGTMAFAADQTPQAELNAVFARIRGRTL